MSSDAPASEQAAAGLAEDVYVCVTQNHALFLDLKQDKYSAVPLGAEPAGDAALDARLAPHRNALLEAGLLSTTSARALAAAPIADVKGHIFGDVDARMFGLTGDDAKGVAIELRDVLDFFVASYHAALDLKSRHISEIVSDVRARKAEAGDPAPDLATIRKLTAIYARLRPWYPRKYLCLYDSLALVEFMARRGVYPDWIYAVQAQPFGAHCWVEYDGLLLNEGSEYAGQFTPIMAV